MKVLVTGGTGFLGGHLVRRLQSDGADVLAPGRNELDLTRPDQVREYIASQYPEVVFHIAACLKRVLNPANLAELIAVNVQGTLNLLHACLEHRPRQVVCAGTADEYGRGEPPFEETQPLAPLTPYGASKATASNWYRAFGQLGLKVVVARLFLLYGPGQPKDFFLPQLLAAHASGTPLKMTPGEQTRDFVWVEDAVEALIRLQQAESGAYNVCTGKERSLKEVVEVLGSVLGSPVPVDPCLEYRAGELWRIAGSPALLEKATGYKPSTSLEEGLRRLVQLKA